MSPPAEDYKALYEGSPRAGGDEFVQDEQVICNIG